MSEIQQYPGEKFAFQQEGRNVLIDRWYWRDNFIPDIRLVINDDYTVEYDNEWFKREVLKESHRRLWRKFIDKLDIGDNITLRRAVNLATPPLYVDESGFKDYLLDVGLGRIKVHSVGKKGKDIIKTALKLLPD